jgi:hypothetical protein
LVTAGYRDAYVDAGPAAYRDTAADCNVDAVANGDKHAIAHRNLDAAPAAHRHLDNHAAGHLDVDARPAHRHEHTAAAHGDEYLVAADGHEYTVTSDCDSDTRAANGHVHHWAAGYLDVHTRTNGNALIDFN